MSAFQSERGVSPVIGVILMVAITVLLAATAATFFMGYGESLTGTAAPTIALNGEFDVDSGGHELTLEVVGGEVVASENVYVHVATANCLGHGTVSDQFDLGSLGVSSGQISAGTRAEVSVGTVCPSTATRLELSRTEVTVSYLEPGGTDGTVLYRWRGPAA